MKKTILVCLLTVCCAAAMQGQSKTDNKTTPLSGVRVNNVAKDPARTIDEKALLRSQVTRLQMQVKLLKQQISQLLADAQAAKANQPHCSADGKTSTSGQGSRDCWPNVCDVVTGSCLQACVLTDDCQPGTACWIDVGASSGQCKRTQ